MKLFSPFFEGGGNYKIYKNKFNQSLEDTDIKNKVRLK